MVLELAQYQIIRKRLCLGRNSLVPQLKLRFRDEINSKRVFEKIDTLSSLLTVLEKRDVIGCDHVAHLQYITEIIAPHDDIIKKILTSRITEHISNNHHTQLLRDERVLPPVPQDCIEKIHRLIKNDIGKKWKELARALFIGEGSIDALEERYRGNLPDMVHEILRRHQEDCGVNFELWRSKLQEALVLARRTDLSLKINTILSFMSVPNTLH